MNIGQWITDWLMIVNTTRFDANDLLEMFVIKTHEDIKEGLSPRVSAAECIEIAEDFITRYSEVK